jgi:recombination protein RecA
MLIIDKRGGDTMPKFEVIPTPSAGLNRALGGGLYTGMTHLLWGTPSAGKTTMCYHILAEAQRMGYRPVIVDSEFSYNEAYAKKCGMNIDEPVIIQGTVVEDILKAVIPYLENDQEKHIFLIDSLSNLMKEEFYNKPDGGKAMGLAARSQGYFLQKLVNYLNKERNIMLFISHQMVDLSGMYATLRGKYGNTVHHNMHNIVKLFLSMSQSEMERDSAKMVTSQRVVWSVEKTKQRAAIGTSGHYYVLPQEGGLDYLREMIDIAVEMGIIERRGAWFYYGEKKWNGAGNIVLSDKQWSEISKKVLAG